MIKIIVDSASDCGGEAFVDVCIPLTVSVGDRDYRDGVELTADGFYRMLTAGGEFPKTSQPSPEAFAQVFQKIKEDGDEAICFTLSSALSGTYQSAVIAREMVEYQGIYIVDTLSVTHLIRILAKHAAAKREEGLSAPQIVEECEALRGRIQVFAGLDTLEYLYKGGRLSRTSAAVGQLAGIKPIATLSDDGKVHVCGKAIGTARAMQTIVAKMQACTVDEKYPVYSIYTYGSENPDAFDKKLAAAGYESKERLQVGPTIGAHVGPNVYGVLFVTKEA